MMYDILLLRNRSFASHVFKDVLLGTVFENSAVYKETEGKISVLKKKNGFEGNPPIRLSSTRDSVRKVRHVIAISMILTYLHWWRFSF